MTDQQKFNDYARFVDITTSQTSKNTDKMTARMDRLQGTTSVQGEHRTEEMQVARLLTSVIGMMAESGEFAEVVKKKITSGKHLPEATTSGKAANSLLILLLHVFDHIQLGGRVRHAHL